MPSCDLPIASQEEYGYLEAMYNLMYIISRRINPDTMAGATYEQVMDICSDIKEIPNRLVPRIRFKDQGKTVRDRLQHFAINLHTAFVVSVACRPALRRDCPFLPEQKKYVAAECKRNLIITVKMFLAMHQLSTIPTRSWAFTYNGLSSALLLGILVNAKTDPEIRNLQGDLIAALSATAAKDQEPEGTKKTDKDIELSGPLWRALMALRNMYKHGSIGAPVKREEGNGAAVPAVSEAASAQPVAGPPVAPAQEGQYAPVEGVDPAHDAARTMADLQRQSMHPNAPLPPDYTRFGKPLPLAVRELTRPGSMSPGQSMAPVPMENMVPVDPSPYMSPLDLYDSIWWGKLRLQPARALHSWNVCADVLAETPEPWNNGFDALNFEFMAQPPPGQQQQPQSGYYF